MNNIPQLTDLVEYELYNENYDRQVIPEPIGWQDDLVQLKRSTKNFTTVTKYSTNLEFVGSGAAFIKQVYELFGFEAKIILTKRRIHPTKQEVEIRYTAILDGYTFKFADNKVKINAVESDLMAKVNGYKSEDVELVRETSIDGVQLDPLNVKNVNIEGKQIQLVSKWDRAEEYDPYRIPFGSGNGIEYVTFHMAQIANSDDQTFSVTNPRLANGNNNLPLNAGTQNMFYSIALEQKTLDLSIDVSFNFRRTRETSMRYHSFQLYLLTFYDDSNNGNSQYRYLKRELLSNDDGVTSIDENGLEVKTLSHSERKVRTLEKGQSWALAVYSVSYEEEAILMGYETVKVQIVEDSLVEPTPCKAIYVYDAIERLLRIMTGETTQILVSDYFGRKELGYDEDGEGAYMAITSGFLARQFEDRPLSINFEDMMKTLFSVLNVSYAFEKRGFKEYIRVEPLEYFFNSRRYVIPKNVASKDIKLSVSKEFSVSGIVLGYAEGGDDYEEAVGLDEYNGKINWLTPLSKAVTQFERISKYRADSTGFEFARRKPQLNFPTTDTNYDEAIFLLDLKPTDTAVLELRKWQDDYAEEPKNVYSPDTAYNLRFSPREMFNRHSFMFSAGVEVYQNAYIRFGSSVGNSEIILDGEKASDDILVSTLENSKFKNVWVEFTLDTDYETEQAIIDNIYGIFEFSSDKGEVFKFRLFDFKNNKYKGLLING